MDSRELISLERLPFKDRLQKQYSFYLDELEQGFMMGRQGNGPVDRTMRYKDLHSDEFRDVLVFGSNSYLGLSNDHRHSRGIPNSMPISRNDSPRYPATRTQFCCRAATWPTCAGCTG